MFDAAPLELTLESSICMKAFPTFISCKLVITAAEDSTVVFKAIDLPVLWVAKSYNEVS